jgi:HrpA-like RNA helicase
MPIPTLLLPGFIIPPKGMSKTEKELLKNMTGMDYLMNSIGDRIGLVRNTFGKIKSNSIGGRVFILKSGTGSGKSTSIPPEFYTRFQTRTMKNIVVTQPRILTAKSIAEDVPINYPNIKMDINVGFSTGIIKRSISEKGITYMTTGTLLQQILSITYEEFVDKYSLIVIDEVHVRDINVDMLLYQIKKMLNLYWDKPNCPIIIIMSATIDQTNFINYFDVPNINSIEFLGSTFPIECNFPKYDISNYIEFIIHTSIDIHTKNGLDISENHEFRDILIFLQGKMQVDKIITALNMFNSNLLKSSTDNSVNVDGKNSEISDSNLINYIAPITLTSATFVASDVEYQNLFSNINTIMIPVYKLLDNGTLDINNIQEWVIPTRRIIVATNVAETGITIKTLKYCIDSGFVNNSEFNPVFGVSGLFNKNIDMGMAIQRKGRVGRKSNGKWYPCYTEKIYNNLNPNQIADILKSDITIQLLGVITTETESAFVKTDNLSINELDEKDQFFGTNAITDSDKYLLTHAKKFNLSTVDLFEVPSSSSFIYSLEKLYVLGFIDSYYNPTVLGMYSKGFTRLSIENIKMILSGYSRGANIMDLITIVAFLSVGDHKIYTKKYTPINVLKPNVSDNEYSFYYKNVIGCQFIEFVLIWNMYSEFLNNVFIKNHKKSNSGISSKFTTNSIIKWCSDNNLQYSGLVAIANFRDEILASMIDLGFNPYYNGLGLKNHKYNLLKIIKSDLNEGICEIKKIKKCLINSYRLNLITWDDTNKTYIINHKKIPVVISKNKLISDIGNDSITKNSVFIIASNIILSESFSGIFEFTVRSPISIIDSLDIDINFALH